MTLLPEVEHALIEAIRRDQQDRRAGRAARVMRWLRSRQRALSIVAGVLVVSGSAAAAFSLVGERSAPLSGIVPAGQLPNTAVSSGSRYDIQIAPSLDPGEISWCISITTRSPSGKPEDRGTGSCDEGAPTTGEPLFGTDLGAVLLRGLAYVFTGPNVAAVRIPGDQIVLTRPDPRLPYQYRAAVFEVTKPTGLGNSIALDREGHPINDLSGTPTEPTQTWLVGQRPAAGACSLSVGPNSGLYQGAGSVVTSIVAAPTIAGHAFLPCIDTDLYFPGPGRGRMDSYLEAAMLLDAAHPGTPPAPLPDMHPVSGHPGIFDRPLVDLPIAELLAPGISAERVGNAWLVVAGGAGTAERIAALHKLIVGPVHLTSVRTQPQPPSGALCTISLTPTTGLQQTTQSAITSLRDPRPAAMIASQRTIDTANARLRRDQAIHRHDTRLIDADRARAALDLQASLSLTGLASVFPPTCATATFYYKQRWPLTATVLLATKACRDVHGQTRCDALKRRAQANVRRVVRPVPGQPSEFTVTSNAFRQPWTIKQLGNAWLIAQGGRPSQQQLLLANLAVATAPNLKRRGANANTPLAFCEQSFGVCSTGTP